MAKVSRGNPVSGSISSNCAVTIAHLKSLDTCLPKIPALSIFLRTSSSAAGFDESKSAGITGPPEKPPSTISVNRVAGENKDVTNERSTPLMKNTWS